MSEKPWDENPYWRDPSHCEYCDRRPNEHGVTWHAEGCPAAAGRTDEVHDRAVCLVSELRDLDPRELETAVHGVMRACSDRRAGLADNRDGHDVLVASRHELVWWSDGAGRWWATPLGKAVLVVWAGKD